MPTHSQCRHTLLAALPLMLFSAMPAQAAVHLLLRPPGTTGETVNQVDITACDHDEDACRNDPSLIGYQRGGWSLTLTDTSAAFVFDVRQHRGLSSTWSFGADQFVQWHADQPVRVYWYQSVLNTTSPGCLCSYVSSGSYSGDHGYDPAFRARASADLRRGDQRVLIRYFLNIVEGGAVPEPATWTMLIAGFGIVGAAARRQRAVAAVSR